jgi:hypothetical protein
MLGQKNVKFFRNKVGLVGLGRPAGLKPESPTIPDLNLNLKAREARAGGLNISGFGLRGREPAGLSGLNIHLIGITLIF